MKRMLVLAIMVMFVFGFSQAFAGDKPKISDLVLKSNPVFKINEYGNLVITFKSDQKPEDVIIQVFGFIGNRTNSKVYYSSKKEMDLEVIEKDGVYEVNVTRKIESPPWPGCCYVTVWIKSGGEESNKEELPQKIQFEM